MTFGKAIDAFIRDMRLEGRITGPVAGTEGSYRKTLYWHADDCDDADPRETDREDVKETLMRWSNPSTIKGRLTAMVSFYRWMMQEGYRKDNPAEQVRRPKVKQANVYRLTREESARMLASTTDVYERRVVVLGICEGLRNSELRGQRGEHYMRPGFVWVSGDIAKGGRERWVPVIAEAIAVVEEIRRTVGPDEYILPRLTPVGGAVQVMRVGGGQVFKQDTSRPCSQQHIGRIVARVAEHAGIRAHIYPHLMRHAYADHVSRHGGVKAAQHLLGHAHIGTTQRYLDQPTLDELVAAVDGMQFAASDCSPAGDVVPLRDFILPVVRPAGFEPANPSGDVARPAGFEQATWIAREAENWLDRGRLAGQALLYRDRLPTVVDPAPSDVLPLRDQT